MAMKSATRFLGVLRRCCLRDTDRVVRWGGDEFVIVRTSSDLDDVAELRFRVSESHSAHTTCSIGFACYPFVAEAPLAVTWEEVLNLADMALYRAKARRDAWLGWSGLAKGARQTELFNLLAVSFGHASPLRTCRPKPAIEAWGGQPQEPSRPRASSFLL
jgi:hypothetical protein